jgi:hypothetical protein
MTENWNVPVTFNRSLPCEKGLWNRGNVRFWACVNWALLWINMARSQNCMITFDVSLHIEFQQNLGNGIWNTEKSQF